MRMLVIRVSFHSSLQTLLFTFAQVSGSNHSSSPGPASKHDNKVPTFVGLANREVLSLLNSHDHRSIVEDCFRFVNLDVMASNMLNVIVIPFKDWGSHRSSCRRFEY